MKLVPLDQGEIGLDDPVGMHVDPFLKRLKGNPKDDKYMNYSSVEDLFGPSVATQTIRKLGKMQSGLHPARDHSVRRVACGRVTHSYS